MNFVKENASTIGIVSPLSCGGASGSCGSSQDTKRQAADIEKGKNNQGSKCNCPEE